MHSSVSERVTEQIAQPYLDLEVIADEATVELGAHQFEFPVEESLGVPVLVTDKVQDLLVVGHGVHTCSTRRRARVKDTRKALLTLLLP